MGSVGSFLAGGTGNLASEVAVLFVAVVGFSFVVSVHFVPEYLEYFADFVFDDHPPNPPLYFYKWGSLVPIHISLPSVLWQHWGFANSWDCGSIFMGEFEVDAGGMG